MSAEIVSAVVGGVAGVITGALSSLVAPWSQWGIEKRRQDRLSKQIKLRQWQAEVAKLLRREAEAVHPDFEKQDWYVEMRPHIPADRRKALEDASAAHSLSVSMTDYREPIPTAVLMLQTELEGIQRRWGLT